MPPKKYAMPRAAATTTGTVAQPKQRKPMAPPSKPPGMSSAEWRVEVQRRDAVTTDRRNRAIAKKARDNAARAAASSSSVDHAGMMNPSAVSHAQYAPWGQQGVGSPWGSSSPGYADGDAHGGFNPNVTFPHGHPATRTPSPAFVGVQYPPYNYSPPAAYASTPTPHLRRGPLPFSHLGDADDTGADMDNIIATGSTAAAASPGFATQDEVVDLNGDMEVELGYVYGEDAHEAQEPEEEEEEEEEPAPVPMKGRQKKKRAARSGEPRIKWTSKEEECLAEAWKVVCLDPTTGANQSLETYWDCIKAEFDERKLVDPYFKGVYMQRGSKAMANHWGRIQLACNKWHGIVEEVAARPESGASVEDQLRTLFARISSSATPAARQLFVPPRSCCVCSPCIGATTKTPTSSTSTPTSALTSARSGRKSDVPSTRPRRHTSRTRRLRARVRGGRTATNWQRRGKTPTWQPRECRSPSSIASPTPRPGPSYVKRRPRRDGRR
ncbi:uncharacterized protein LOC125545785 [Triticum urartu]|uniref:uncharacterized protein LOC125545785 n=1 Tax=Triticum urartu TaxID=4572 RepID=UPI0020435543|nr:uncharacterized protein LOC125545785 [Triticum urartu]XP_048565777.1 uncharacterized protein LOC125545785 [Triticum urartu]